MDTDMPSFRGVGASEVIYVGAIVKQYSLTYDFECGCCIFDELVFLLHVSIHSS